MTWSRGEVSNVVNLDSGRKPNAKSSPNGRHASRVTRQWRRHHLMAVSRLTEVMKATCSSFVTATDTHHNHSLAAGRSLEMHEWLQNFSSPHNLRKRWLQDANI